MRIEMPTESTPPDTVFAEMEAARADDVAWREGRLGLYVHFGGDEVLAVAKEAYQRFFSENALGPTVFPSLAKFEREVVGWTASLLNAGPDATGNITSGGTESIFLAMKSVRDWTHDTRGHDDLVEVVAPYSAHPAFNKAAHLLGMRIVRTPLRDDLRVDVDAMAAAITPRTAGIVGSAPGFPHGVVDPISEIAALARKHDLWLHVDSCVGGYVLPFARRLQYPVPDFDFGIDGVRSMSADLHKYGFAAKGASTIVYRNSDDYAYQPYAFDEWPRGRFVAPTLPGSRPGGAIAAAWAVMRHLGVAGYTDVVASIMRTRDAIWNGINEIPELAVLSDPEGPIISYTAQGLDIFAVAEALTERGWFVTRGTEPRLIHLGMLTAVHVPIVETYLSDLRAAVAEVRAGRTAKDSGPVTYGG